MALINIKRISSTLVVFEPDPAELDSVSDFAVWANLDPDSAHQPTASGKPENWWMENSLPKFVAGQPAAVSPVINLNGPANTTLPYEDGVDRSIKGTVKFVNTPLA